MNDEGNMHVEVKQNTDIPRIVIEIKLPMLC